MAEREQQEQYKARWKLIGPGIVVAATGVGSGDMVASLVAGERFGYALLWAVVVGCVVKIALAEATGRWHLASGQTIFDGWRGMGVWTFVFFAPYIVIWGFVYGATAMSATALPLQALFPAVPLWVFAVAAGITGLLFVWFNRYPVLERVMTVLVGLLFVTVVGLAVYLVPDLGSLAGGLVPSTPEDSLFYTLGLIGGVGGTITMAAYGFWVNAKGWRSPAWIRMMRLDNRVAYITTGVFVVAMLIVGAELLHTAQIAMAEGDEGLITLAEVLRERFGTFVSVVFLVGFFAAAYSSLLGVWHGVSLMFADFVGNIRGRADRSVEERETSWEFRAFLLWLTFPSMLLLLLDRPIALVIAYGVLGSAFMPFLAFTLMWLLNTRRTPREWRSGILSNTGLAVAGALFLVLCGQEVWNRITGV
ncbi:Nramp family divalent metal transporter [Streptomonospora litoralis]|uniref:Divalent metal cation transporter MntH n=1 Tax=Streptomonospora litoralis TaxID=2498135 RepID=A0A4P6Q7T2_9ACTN|nr:Nramp family divalent metal transporter [Streptomonospora litoralis]QBI55501.1 Divalent metal cation transporter MntH [Streptomonospora litoralis]